MSKTNEEVLNRTNNNLSYLLNPKTIAVIGASNDPEKISGRPIEYLKRYGFEGEIYPVNPKYEEVQGLTAFKHIKDAPDNLDLVIVAIAAKFVVETLKICIEKNVKSCMIFSSGFAEMDEEGEELQYEIANIAQESGMVIVGPNCQGIANFENKSVTSFSTAFVEGELVTGSSAILSQSGAVAAMVYDMQISQGTGIKYWASTGNEVDLNTAKMANYILEEDNDVNVIQLYIESIKNTTDMIILGKKSRELEKPILVLKSGKSDEAQKAANSHTGALAAEDKVVDKFLEKQGFVRVDDVNELSSFSNVFKLSKKVKGNNVAIISNSGGLGVMMVDKCKEYGLNIASFTEETKEELSKILPLFASYENPIDITAQLLNDKHLLSSALPILMKDPNVDTILFGLGIIGKGYDIDNIVKDVVNAQHSGDKMIGVAWVGSEEGRIKEFNNNNVPAFEDPTLCVKAIARYTDYCLDIKENKKNISEKGQERLASETLLRSHLSTSNGFLSEYDSKRILGENLSISEMSLFMNEKELEEAAPNLDYPVVMKVNSEKIQHKTEVGGVKLGIQNETELLDAYINMKNNEYFSKQNKPLVVIVEKMASKGFEVSLGFKKDPVYGPVLMVASGGVYIEVLKDFQLLIPPVSSYEINKAIDSLIMSPLLQGARGEALKDKKALCNVIKKFSHFVMKYQDEIEEIDMNPIIVHEEGKGVSIVDALIKLKEGSVN